MNVTQQESHKNAADFIVRSMEAKGFEPEAIASELLKAPFVKTAVVKGKQIAVVSVEGQEMEFSVA